MHKIGGILLGIGLGILACWGLYRFFRYALPSLPLPVKIATVATAIVGARFVTSMVMSGAAEMVAYGTKVKIA